MVCLIIFVVIHEGNDHLSYRVRYMGMVLCLRINSECVGVLQLRTLEEKVADLQRQLVDKKTADEASEVERARKEVKDEAMKADGANMEVLHERLIILENVARKANHDSKDKYTMILSRFHVNKSKPSFVAALVLKLLSSKEECLILDAEQKLKKIFDTNTSSAMQTPAWGTPYANVFPNLATPGPSSAFPGMQPTFPWSAPYQPFAPRGSSSSFSPRPRMRTPFSGRPQLCFRCRRPGHLIRDCPQNQ